MRRSLVAALAVPALLLSACGDGDEPEVQDAPTTEEQTSEEPTTEEPTDEAPTTEAPAPTTEEPTTEEPTTEEPTDDGATTEEPTDDGATTEEPTDDGGENASGDGQAAADRTKEWLVAFVNGEEAVCDLMLDLDSEGPMKDDETDYPICVATFPSMASSMFDAETAGIIESMQINGADVTGDTAIVNKDHFSALFAEGMGDQVITLRMVDGEWYVDMNESFNAEK
ncbi:hypothetical protein [Ornithinimicrobium ciconiae]|uniref:hypothetical protein n=1 Tax=Ornithinimicrobium ciconiae TaxID=2594265 RepID=UPI00192D76D5|nr:hypothetical protein [Ornithinimicrobium ciconiae]